LFIIMLAIASAAPGLVTGILWVIVIDLAIFALTGPTPMAPICTLVTMFVWRFRGNAVTSLPYKAIIGAVYIWNISNVLTCGDLFGGVAYQIDQCPKVCGSQKDEECDSRFNLKIGGMLLNSTFLAFFRF